MRKWIIATTICLTVVAAIVTARGMFPSEDGQHPERQFIPTPAPHVTPTYGRDWDPELDGHNDIASDGNDISDMELGDTGVFTPQSSMKKQPAPVKPNYANMIAIGKSYLGTPYVYGAKRGQDKTFDCSSFVQFLYKKAFNFQLPANSRTQQEYVKAHGKNRFIDWRKNLKVGDLIFMGKYISNKQADYKSYKRNVTPIAHVAIYIGKTKDGKMQILHTASAPTGVRIQPLEGHLAWRIVYTGHAW